MYELNTRYTLEMPKGLISPSGIVALVTFIASQELKEGDWQAENPTNERRFLPALPEDWDYSWVITGKGDYVGTFPKRVAKYYYTQLNLRCPRRFLEQVGNIAKAHSETGFTYRFDVVNRFTWRSGDFGDSGSCYWGGHSYAKVMLVDNGGQAIRFFDDSDKGIARAWLVPIEEKYILFNGYGLSTLDIARIFAQWQGLSYKKIDLANNDQTGGTLYINSGAGYLVGNQADIDGIDAYDFEWDGAEYQCEHCERDLTEDELYVTPNDNHLCADCYYEVCSSCENCGRDLYRDDLYYADDSDYCERCLDRLFTRCVSCDEYRRHDTIDKHGRCEYCQE